MFEDRSLYQDGRRCSTLSTSFSSMQMKTHIHTEFASKLAHFSFVFGFRPLCFLNGTFTKGASLFSQIRCVAIPLFFSTSALFVIRSQTWLNSESPTWPRSSSSLSARQSVLASRERSEENRTIISLTLKVMMIVVVCRSRITVWWLTSAGGNVVFLEQQRN